MRRLYGLVVLAVLLSPPALAMGKVESCEITTTNYMKALEMRDAGMSQDDAMQALQKANETAPPYIISRLKSDVGSAYRRNKTTADRKKERATFFDICMSL